MSVAEILDDLEYGPAPESDSVARAWLKERDGTTGLFINGEWRQPKTDDWFETLDPATGANLARVAVAGPTD
ncbi:MAG: hypothetical protein GY798_25945, partial [Hyphomicrobiales bacterium]|nr:hypothetical protein [Hyphomicrobiales bacterium]